MYKMRKQKTNYLLFAILFCLLPGCEKLSEQDIYKRPDWLPGKLYTTVSVQENLALFTECLRLAGLDKILDVSGSWSVFAPTDDAMKQFLLENGYSSVSDIPPGELERIAEFHVIQNPWSLEQLKSLGINGWKKDDDGDTNPYAFKRETMLRNSSEKYWIKKVNKKEAIVLDSTISQRYKKVYVQSRKYVPIFYDEYLKANGITSEDFRFYFKRPFEQGNVYYAGAKIIKADILAENGFVHIIDRVVNPMLNAKEFMERELPGETYKLFMEMVGWYYPNFEVNKAATFNQPEVRLGGLVDTLWDLNYKSLPFDLHSEFIYNMNQTLMRHNGIFVPTDETFGKFIDGVLTSKSGFPHWADHKSLPPDIVKLIINQNFKSAPIYPSTNLYTDIFKKTNRYKQNEENIIRKEFGSNCTFIGLDKYNPDKVFTSVTGPVFCRPNYSIFRRAMIYSGTYDAIANHGGNLYFFPIPDYALLADSSLVLNWIDQDEDRYNFLVANRLTQQIDQVGSSTLKNWILNQVGTSISYGSDGKEVIRTLGGNTVTWDHSTNTIQGAFPSTIGYKSNVTVTNTPVQLDEPTGNGKTFTVSHWFRFSR